MRRPDKITVGGNVLPSVIVVTLLLTLGVLTMLALWDMDSNLFVRNNRIKAWQADIRSALNLYRVHPEIYTNNGESVFALFEGEPLSEVRLEVKPWGLYEIVSVTSIHGNVHGTAMMGAADGYIAGLYYANTGSALTLTGNTNLHGAVHVPRNGVIYGQIQSVFFSGEKISPEKIRVSEKSIPQPQAGRVEEVTRLLALLDADGRTPLETDSLSVEFYGEEPAVFDVLGDGMELYALSGNIILAADKVKIDASCDLRDIIIIANNITVGNGFKGSAQLFARDTLIVGENVRLEYPSGIYSGNYAEIKDRSVVSGYAIVCGKDKQDIRKANYRQSRLARVRGLLYVDGNAVFQGIVSGAAYLSQSVYYSAEGYYKDMVYDATVLENTEMAMPLWIPADDAARDEIKRVR